MKNFLIKILKKIYNSIMYLPRATYYRKMKKKLMNTNFSIIASDCFGSVVYHNLRQRFNSPTINLFFSKDDFYQFVLHLKEYLTLELVELEDQNVPYPVGSLTYNDQTIRIDFMHYKSFEEAKNKWDERKLRVDFSNIYIIQTVANGITQEYLDSFAALPFKHKMLITHNNNYTCDCMIIHQIFSKDNYKPGNILKYKSLFSRSRYMDDIDYVSFLNER